MSNFDDTSALAMNALQEHIHILEKELAETKLQLAAAKRSEGYLICELKKMRSVDGEATNDGTLFNQETHSVPTKDPFSRKKIADKVPHKRRTSFTKVLNRGSCSSAMNLLALAQVDSNASMQSLYSGRRNILNPNSCASGLNLLIGIEGAQHDDSMISMSSFVSASASSLPRASQRNVASKASLSLGNNFALLFGNVSLRSSSSLRRINRSGSNARLNRRCHNQSSTSNADWDEF